MIDRPFLGEGRASRIACVPPRRVVLARWCALAAALLALFGCVPSLNPIYSADTQREDDRLLGEWREVVEGEETEEDATRWTVVKTGANAYRLTVAADEYDERLFPGVGEPPDPGDFELRLVEVRDRMFADVMPERPLVRNDLYQFQLLRSHTLWRISIAADRVTVSTLDPGWLEPRLESGAVAILHALLDEEVVLTAPTAELQAFFAGLPDDAFSDPLVFVRR